MDHYVICRSLRGLFRDSDASAARIASKSTSPEVYEIYSTTSQQLIAYHESKSTVEYAKPCRSPCLFLAQRIRKIGCALSRLFGSFPAGEGPVEAGKHHLWHSSHDALPRLRS